MNREHQWGKDGVNESFWDGHGVETEAKQVWERLLLLWRGSVRGCPREAFRTAAGERKILSIIVPAAEFAGLSSTSAGRGLI